MSEGPATFGDIQGRGLLQVTQSGEMKQVMGHFRPTREEDQGKLLDLLGDTRDYVGPVEEQGETRKMRVEAFVQRESPGSGGGVRLVGGNSPESVE